MLDINMKYIDSDKIDGLAGRRLEKNDIFNFRCYPGIACFNRCCRNLNLFLYPYDIVRLKKRLNVTSDIFLEKYVDIVLRPSNFFPEVLLRMADNPEKTCPFLTASGCSVYPDRPDTCRTFPIEQGVFYDAQHDRSETMHFFRPPDFCLGQYEKEVWTTRTWSDDQDAAAYHEMTARWSELKRLFQTDPWGSQGTDGPKAKMAFMATHNIDRFKDFLFNSTFLRRYKVRSKVLARIRSDDADLMAFGFEWVKFYVWGIPSKDFRLR
jgi:Fe-S-cluster containining protein